MAPDIGLSVVIPTYNRADLLDACLRRLAAQSGAGPFEVVVADDGSTDHTPAVGAAWSDAADFEVHYIRLAKGCAGAARNRGVEAARGTRILFLGDDILAGAELVARHTAAAARWGDDAVVVGHVGYRAGERTPFMRFLEEEGVHHAFPQMAAAGDAPLPGRYFYACNASVPRHAHESIGGFDERITRAWEDSEYGLRLDSGGFTIHYEPEARGEHVHPITLDGYVGFLRAGRADVGRVLGLARDRGLPIPSPPPRPLLDRLVNDTVVGVAAAAIARGERLVPDRVRRGVYRGVLRYERRRARLGVAPAHA